MTVTELCAPLTVAPGLDDSTVMAANWFHQPNGSVYLKFVPQDMTKEDIQATFEFAGQINRIDIVNSAPNKTTGSTYRMAFIHFDYWYSTGVSLEFRHNIIATFPKEFRMHSLIACRELSVTINTRPVPKTDYNVDQLSDMFHRLQEQFTTTVEKQANEIAELKQEVAELKKKTNHTDLDVECLARSFDSLGDTVERLNSDLDEMTAWADGTAGDIHQMREKVDSKLDEFKADIQRQYVCTDSQLSEMKYEVGYSIGDIEKKQEKQGAEVSKLNYERCMETRQVRVELRQLRERLEFYKLDELTQEMRAKNVEYSSMSRVFTRDIGELIKIRHNVVPEVEKLVAFMKKNPEYLKFYDEACQEEFYK